MKTFEQLDPAEAELTERMIAAMKRKLDKSYAAGHTLRGAHAKSTGFLDAELTVLPDLPEELQVGVFRPGQTYRAQIRLSNADESIRSDRERAPRGLALKLLGVQGARYGGAGEQDFLLMSTPTMPLGTLKLFHDAVVYSLNYHPLVFAGKMVLSGHGHVLREVRSAQIHPSSPLDLRYWSTTPYRFGEDRAVKYSLVPTSAHKSTLPKTPSDDYLAENAQRHLDFHEASFDFRVQFWRDEATTPIEDAAVEWSESAAPFVRVATLRVPPQNFLTRQRAELAERLRFSPGNSLSAHAPLGGLNRARIVIYDEMSRFRAQRNAAG